MTTLLATQTRQSPGPPSIQPPRLEVPNEKGAVRALKNRADHSDGTERRIRACLTVIAELLAHSDC